MVMCIRKYTYIFLPSLREKKVLTYFRHMDAKIYICPYVLMRVEKDRKRTRVNRFALCCVIGRGLWVDERYQEHNQPNQNWNRRERVYDEWIKKVDDKKKSRNLEKEREMNTGQQNAVEIN